MEIFFLLDIIIKFAVLKRVKYIQLANRSTMKFFFFFPSSYKFHFSFGEICGLQSQIFMV